MMTVRQAKTAQARMTADTASRGVPAERRLSHISTGRVCVSRSVRNSAITNSLSEMTKAKSADEMIPVETDGTTISKNVCRGFPPRS